ncbi:DUF732 domain-containing protein [Rhodococcus triatomae]|nr:hypothetical protein G419_18534 [Rhodococcus triatomae BKS 15-14]
MVRVRTAGAAALAVVCCGLLGCSSASGAGQEAHPPAASTVAAAPSTADAVVSSTAITPSFGGAPDAPVPPSAEQTMPLPEPVVPDLEARPQAVAPTVDARSPEEIVAGSGERGRRYLDALRGAGLPPAGMDAAEILYADGTCRALASGASRAEVLAEFDGVARAYAQFTPLSPDRVAEIYVATAERTYC